MAHSTLKHLYLGLTAALMVLTALSAALPVEAATAYRDQGLPPLPEWPVIGPVLRFLGIVKEKPEPIPVTPTPNPNLPEYTIETREDLEKLQEIETGQSVRIRATEEALNQIIKDTLDANTSRQASLVMKVGDGAVTVMIDADTELIKDAGQNIPGLNADTVSVEATLDVDPDQCVPFVNIMSMEVNSWSFGFRTVAQRTINTQVTEVWPNTLCLEGVFFTPGVVSVEGYRRP
jgi:hypothetical protein